MGRRRHHDQHHQQQRPEERKEGEEMEDDAHEEGAERAVSRRPSSFWTLTQLLLVLPLALLMMLGLLPPAAAAAASPPAAPASPSSPPLINAHLLLAVHVVAQHTHGPASTQPTHLSLRLSCSSPSTRLTQNRDVVLLPLSSSQTPLLVHEPGVAPGVATAEATFTVEMARAPRQCRVSAFDKESGARVGIRAVILPGAGSDAATDALLHVELPVSLGRRLRRHEADILRTASFILRGGRLVLEALVAHSTLCLRQLCLWGLQVATAAAAGAGALAWAAVPPLHAILTPNPTGVREVDGILRILTAAGVLALLLAALPNPRRLLHSAFGEEAGDRSHQKPARTSRGTGGGGSGKGGPVLGQELLQHEQQRSRRPFVRAQWHCVMHDREGGASRMEERALASLADAVAGGGRSAVEATVGDVVGRLLNHRVRGVMLSYKGQ